MKDANVEENKVMANKAMLFQKKDQSTRMLLRGMSDNFKFFIFEDRVNKEFKVYKLAPSEGKKTLMTKLLNVKQFYEFVYVRHLKLFDNETFGYMK